MKTRRDAVAYAQQRAKANGHQLGRQDKGVKWMASCRRCGAMAVVEPFVDATMFDAQPEWGAFGNTILRTCAGIQRSKRRRQLKQRQGA